MFGCIVFFEQSFIETLQQHLAPRLPLPHRAQPQQQKEQSEQQGNAENQRKRKRGRTAVKKSREKTLKLKEVVAVMLAADLAS